MDLSTKFIEIDGLGVGEKSALKLKKLGLETPSDLFFNFPRRYEDYATVTRIQDLSRDFKFQPVNLHSSLQNKEFFTIKGTLLGVANKKTRRRGFMVTEGIITDSTGSIRVVWFNQPYIAKMLKASRELIFHGKVSFDGFHSSLVIESPTWSSVPKIVPVYSETAGLTSFFVAKLFSKVKPLISSIEEWLPSGVMDKYKLLGINEALTSIHEPKSMALLDAARRRLAFDELFMVALQGAIKKDRLRTNVAPSLCVDMNILKFFIDKLPFALTGDQKKAAWQIIKGLGQESPMHRLLNGDVGSGKTVVAAIASFICARSSCRTLLMVPTEILAMQHFETFKEILEPLGVTVGIVTSSKKCDLDSSVLIGTQALIQKDFSTGKVGLVIVDEQHRFGVVQRAKLSEITDQGILNTGKKMSPHFLSMTATPIPRTLHMVLFGDLEVSRIREKPAERKEIKTRFVEPANRDKAYKFISGQIAKGRQVFVICPLIEDKAKDDKSPADNLFEAERKSVKAEFEKLGRVFSAFRIAILHGKMKSAEKAETMRKFAEGETQILISTSVIEVGIDVPNASVMIVEDAERFGLAQIHQFRGRVGRGEHQSYCFLFSSNQNEKVLERLKLLEKIDDGFRLAEADLEIRGPGAVFGTEQSGIFDLKIASFSDQATIMEASQAAKEISAQIEKYPNLEKRLTFSLANRYLE